MSYQINTVDEAYETFDSNLKDLPASLCGDTIIANNILMYAEHDVDALNQEWANWLDAMVEAGQAPQEARNWDWEDAE
ncbi:hypothetical protein [Vibrio phage vB_VpS_PG28]|nr:hypothetical protein [Vibrio phage vB_VpS_PG28]